MLLMVPGLNILQVMASLQPFQASEKSQDVTNVLYVTQMN